MENLSKVVNFNKLQESLVVLSLALSRSIDCLKKHGIRRLRSVANRCSERLVRFEVSGKCRYLSTDYRVVFVFRLFFFIGVFACIYFCLFAHKEAATKAKHQICHYLAFSGVAERLLCSTP